MLFLGSVFFIWKTIAHYLVNFCTKIVLLHTLPQNTNEMCGNCMSPHPFVCKCDKNNRHVIFAMHTVLHHLSLTRARSIQVVGSSKCGNEPSGFIKCEEVLD
jgi:hypothetical protein